MSPDLLELDFWKTELKILADSDPDSAQAFMAILFEELRDSSLATHQNFWYLNFYLSENANYKAIALSDLLNFAERRAHEDPSGTHQFLNSIGSVLYDFGRYDESILVYRKAMSHSNNEHLNIFSKIGLGRSFYIKSDVSEALSHYFEAIQLAEVHSDSAGLAEANFYIGLVYHNQFNYDKALEYYAPALEIALATENNRIAGNIYNNTGNIDLQKRDFEAAEIKLRKALDWRKKGGFTRLIGATYNNLGNMFRTNGVMDSALVNFEKGYQISLERGDKLGATYPLFGMALIEQGRGNFDNAEFYALQMFELGKQIASKERKQVASRILSEFYAERDMYKQAYEYHILFKTYQDSITNESEAAKIAALETRNEMESEQREFELQTQLQTAELETELFKRRSRSIALLILFMASLGIVYFNRKKNKEMLAINSELEISIAKQKEIQNQLITEKNITEAQAKKLQKLDEEKSRFFANISHEFRTPLTLIISPLENMKKGKKLSADEKLQIDMALRNSKRLMKLVGQLLDLAKFEANLIKHNPEIIILSDYLKNLTAGFQGVAERYGITFIVEIPDKNVLVNFDPDQLDKVFSNLLSNAFKFTGKEGEVVLSLTSKAKEVIISIQDTGMGIEAEHLPKLFDRFYQVEKSEVQPGTGIGLALAREITELNEGRIEVESEVGTGSVFTVFLPEAQESMEVSRAEIFSSSAEQNLDVELLQLSGTVDNDEETAVNTDGDDDKKTLMVVDDSADIRTYLKNQFKDTYHIVEAESGSKALEKIQERIPDLIISDVMMPDGDGFSLLKELRANPETDFLPIILLTAKAEAEDKLEGLGIGADDYLTKPFSMEEVSLRVRNLIERQMRLQKSFKESKSPSQEKHQISPDLIKIESADSIYLKKVREIIQENMYNEDFSVEELANQMFQSRIHLYRKLKELTDETPSQLIKRMRLERGANLIEQKAGSISEVAYSVGFKSIAQFSRSFCDHYQETPSEYMRKRAV